MFTQLSLVLLFSFLLLIPRAIGQEVEVRGEEREYMIRDVLASYPNEFKEIDITAMTRVDKHYLRIAYEAADGPWEVVLQMDNDKPILVETGQVLSEAEWPLIIHDAVKNTEYTPNQIKRVLKVSTPYGEQGYRLDVYPDCQDTGKIKRLYFDRLGQYKNPIF